MSKQITCTKYNSTCLMSEETCAKRYKRACEETVFGESIFPICLECPDGKKAYDKHFKNAPEIPKQINKFRAKRINKPTKKGESPYSCKYSKSLTPQQFADKTQVSQRCDPRQQQVSMVSQENIGNEGESCPEPETNIEEAKVPHFNLGLFLKAQIPVLGELIHTEQITEALQKIKLINKEIESRGMEAVRG